MKHLLPLLSQGPGDSDASSAVQWKGAVLAVRFLFDADWRKVEVYPPPDDHSEDVKREINELLDMQNDAKRAYLLQEITEQSDAIISSFRRLCQIDSHSHPSSLALIHCLETIASTVALWHKAHFIRLRPSLLNARVRPMIVATASPSYPSTTATQASIVSNFLMQVITGDDSLVGMVEHLAHRISINREWAGVHYHSDTVAGQQLGFQIWECAKQYDEIAKLLVRSEEEFKQPKWTRYHW